MAKPSFLPTWTDGDSAKITAPTGAKQLLGYVPVEKPSPFVMNYMFHFIGLWIQYLDGVADTIQAIQGIYDAVVGVDGSHATINDVIADMNGTDLPLQDVNVFIKDPQTLNSTQIINKEGVRLEFHPQAHIAKGTATLGIQIDAKNCEIVGGRFLNFNLGSDKAIQLTANAKNCFISRAKMYNNDTDVEDLGSNNSVDYIVEIL